MNAHDENSVGSARHANAELPPPVTVDSPPQSWREQKSLNARHLADELERRQRRESEQAAAMLREFVAQATAKGIEPVRLHARGYNGSTRYKTNVTGWYLKQNETVAVDVDANFYVLSVQGGLVARFTGTTITPSDPPLVLGLGGRDGESLDMSEAVDRILNPEKYR
jgi:hypothetical protein